MARSEGRKAPERREDMQGWSLLARSVSVASSLLGVLVSAGCDGRHGR